MEKLNRKVCKGCGKKFVNDYNNQRYCLDKCKIKTYEQNRKQKNLTCINCNKSFDGNRNNKFCSKECKGEHRKKNFDKFNCQCINCGKIFDSVLKDAKYCSSKCRGKVYREKNKFKGVCIICGNKFESNDKKQNCCSNKCEGSRRSEMARDRNGDSFPNQRARVEYKRRQRKIKTLVEKVELNRLIVRDKGICQLCGELVDLRVHYNHRLAPTNDHIIPLALGGETSYKNCQLAHRGCNSKKSHFVQVEEVRKWQDLQKAQMS